MKKDSETRSSSHTKYRRKVIYGKLKNDIGQILRNLCEQKGVEIIEAEACKDHIHLLVSITPYLSVAQFTGSGALDAKGRVFSASLDARR